MKYSMEIEMLVLFGDQRKQTLFIWILYSEIISSCQMSWSKIRKCNSVDITEWIMIHAKSSQHLHYIWFLQRLAEHNQLLSYVSGSGWPVGLYGCYAIRGPLFHRWWEFCYKLLKVSNLVIWNEQLHRPFPRMKVLSFPTKLIWTNLKLLNYVFIHLGSRKVGKLL